MPGPLDAFRAPVRVSALVLPAAPGAR